MSEKFSIGVVGAGQMGAGIAHSCAQAGLEVILWDQDSPAVTKGIGGVKRRLEQGVEKGKISAQDKDLVLSKISAGTDISQLSKCNLVIEAIIENVDIKGRLFTSLDQILAPDAIIASNTSSISLTRIAAFTKRPDKVIGLHFMNPVPVMQLVEVIKGLQTSEETYKRGLELVATINKTAILAPDAPGFVVNRILCPMINEAIFLLQQGVTPQDIDSAMKLGTNQPMGPLELADFVGLDTLLFILQILHRELGEDKYRPCPLLVKYVEAGWYGRKNGRGFYVYP